MTHDQAKQVLDALNQSLPFGTGTEPFSDAARHKQAIAIMQRELDAPEVEQEPMAYFDFQERGFYWASNTSIDPVPVSIRVEPMALYTAPQERKPQKPFTKHEVEQSSDWSDWVCPDPKGYLMKCCDCGLVHEAQFAVVRYETESNEDCEPVVDQNVQSVFRMRRSEDTAQRVGGLPMTDERNTGATE